MITESNKKLGILKIRCFNKDKTSYQIIMRCTREVQCPIIAPNTVLMRLKISDDIWHITRFIYLTSGDRSLNVNVNYFILYYKLHRTASAAWIYVILMLLKMTMWKVEVQKDKTMSRCSSAFEKFTVSMSALVTDCTFVKLKRLTVVAIFMFHG
jgi:hypothetical protein